jgi:serine/threonine protein kinase
LRALNNRTNKFQIKPSFDIFSLGLVIFYTCTKGNHPFKDNDSGEVRIPANIIKDNLQWKYFNGSENFSAVNLLQKMLDKNPDNRATTPTLLLKHPFFWDDEKSLRFILAVANDHKMTNL